MTFDTDPAKLHPLLREKATLIIAQLNAEGFSVGLKEGYRSPQEQEKRLALGERTTPWHSLMQYGLACELEDLSNGMERRLSGSSRQIWPRFSALAKEQGLVTMKNRLQLPFVKAEDLLSGNYPLGGHGGDATWLQNLRKNIEAWPKQPKPNIADLDETNDDFSASEEQDEKASQ